MSADRIELGLGIEDSRPPQVRFGLEQSLGTIRLVAAHSAQPLKLQTLARFEVDEASGHVTCELLPLGGVDMARAFGTSYGAPIPISIVGEGKREPSAEDDGFTTIDLSGLIGPRFRDWPKNLVIEPKRKAEPVEAPITFEITTGDPRFDPDAPVKINGYAFVRVGCAKCGGSPVVAVIDLDDLCGPCATKWVLSEGQVERDRQDGESGIDDDAR